MLKYIPVVKIVKKFGAKNLLEKQLRKILTVSGTL